MHINLFSQNRDLKREYVISVQQKFVKKFWTSMDKGSKDKKREKK